MNQARYIVINKNDPSLVWSNKLGWIDDDKDGKDIPTIFYQDEVSLLNLPIDGEWIEL